MWWTLAACFHAGLHVRGGDVLERGQVGLEADGTPLTVAPAQVDLGDDTVSATFGARQMLHPMMALFVPPYSVGGGLRAGLGRGWELTADLALQEATVGARVALAEHVALSAAGGVYPTEFPIRANPGGTVTLDATTGPLRWSLGARVGQQPYVGFLPARAWPGCGSFGEPGCGEYSPVPSIEAVRTEVRAIGAIGVTAPFRSADDDEPQALTIALAPWVTAWAADADPRVRGPVVRGVHDFRASVGGSVWVGLEWGPFGPRARRDGARDRSTGDGLATTEVDSGRVSPAPTAGPSPRPRPRRRARAR